jgi:transposase
MARRLMTIPGLGPVTASAMAASVQVVSAFSGMRGLDKVRAEFSLTALVYNLRRALNILGVARLMAAMAR